MSIIVAVREHDGTWIGSDTLVNDGNGGISGYMPKWGRA